VVTLQMFSAIQAYDNLPFLVSHIRAFWRWGWAPECPNVRNQKW